MGIILIITIVLFLFCHLNRAEIPLEFQDVDKIYTDKFNVNIRSSVTLSDIVRIFEKEEFIYVEPIFSTFHLFRKEGILKYSLEPYSVNLLKQLQDRLSSFVVSIEQDCERRVFPKGEQPVAVSGFRKDEPPDDVRAKSFLRSLAPEWSPGIKPVEHAAHRRPIHVAVVDARFQMNHSNLVNAIAPELCYDFVDNDANPSVDLNDPKLTFPPFYHTMSHGTKCMGRIGATADRGCDQGVAPNVKLVGLRIITDNGRLSDKREGLALSYKSNVIDVYSCSYGIGENYGFFKPESVTAEALKRGVEEGRYCRGSIFVYPSGNGHIDNCNADGYANSIYTITIANVNRDGSLPSNIETCPCALAATVGQGYNTTDLHSRCTDSFYGVSASTPVAAGYIGEMLTVNPLLSKRDVEHIIVKTASRKGLDLSIPWRHNGVGLLFNDQIGFGLMDLNKMKQAASTWSFVPEAHTCVIPAETSGEHELNFSKYTAKQFTVNSSSCHNTLDFVGYLEHVQIELSLKCSDIAEVAVHLISPMNTSSPILTKMNMSKKVTEKFKDLKWTFMSVHFWGENPYGLWTVEVRVEDATATVECMFGIKKMVFHGTEKEPEAGGGPILQCDKRDLNEHDESMSVGEYVGIGMGIFVFLMIGFFIFIYCYFFRCRDSYCTQEQTCIQALIRQADSFLLLDDIDIEDTDNVIEDTDNAIEEFDRYLMNPGCRFCQMRS